MWYSCVTYMKPACVSILYFRKLMACKADVERLVPEMSACLEEMKDFENQLVMYQKQRQKDIWTLLRYVVSTY